MNLFNWTPQERDVGYFIVEFLADKDPKWVFIPVFETTYKT